MDVQTLRWLGLRFSKLLSYSYAGFLMIVLGSVLNPATFAKLREAMSWELMALAAIVVGAGVHAFHRTLFVPVHHFFTAALLWPLLELWPKRETVIPTRWLGTLEVPFFWQIPAYSALRHSDAWLPSSDGDRNKDLLERWDLIHAELGLLLLTGEAFAVATAVMLFAPALIAPVHPNITPRLLGSASALLLAAPVFAAYSPHRTECLAFKKNKEGVVKTLKEMGFIDDRSKAGSFCGERCRPRA